MNYESMKLVFLEGGSPSRGPKFPALPLQSSFIKKGVKFDVGLCWGDTPNAMIWNRGYLSECHFCHLETWNVFARLSERIAGLSLVRS